MNPAEDIKEKLESAIKTYKDFSDADKETWVSTLDAVPLDYQVFLLGLFETSPEDVLKLNENIKAKQEILKSGDEAAWQELLEKEKKELEELAVKEEGEE